MKWKIIPLLLALLFLAGCTSPTDAPPTGGEIVTVTDETFDTVVLESDKIVLLDFYADWCGPCKQMAPILEEIAAERGDILVGKIDVDTESVLAARFGIEAIPTLVIIRDGEVLETLVGLRTKVAILSLLPEASK